MRAGSQWQRILPDASRRISHSGIWRLSPVIEVAVCLTRVDNVECRQVRDYIVRLAPSVVQTHHHNFCFDARHVDRVTLARLSHRLLTLTIYLGDYQKREWPRSEPTPMLGSGRATTAEAGSRQSSNDHTSSRPYHVGLATDLVTCSGLTVHLKISGFSRHVTLTHEGRRWHERSAYVVPSGSIFSSSPAFEKVGPYATPKGMSLSPLIHNDKH